MKQSLTTIGYKKQIAISALALLISMPVTTFAQAQRGAGSGTGAASNASPHTGGNSTLNTSNTNPCSSAGGQKKANGCRCGNHQVCQSGYCKPGGNADINRCQPG